MAYLVVRNLEEEVKVRLRRQADRHGHSIEEEVHDILRKAVGIEKRPATPLGSRLSQRFARIGLDKNIKELHGQRARPTIFKR